MNSLLSPLDMVIFFGSLIVIMIIGLWAGRKEDTSEDFYLAGRTTRWWGVAGSIFGSNVSANHIMGMMGVGYMYGFAQSHFEITAIAGLLMLCYVFLPVYRRLNVFTLSEYLSRRYDDSSRIAYALIMIVIMVVIQMVPGFYIGSRSLNELLFDYGDTAKATAVVDDSGAVASIAIENGGMEYTANPVVKIAPPPRGASNQSNRPATASAVSTDGVITAVTVDDGGQGYDSNKPPRVTIVGASFNENLSPGDVNPKWYVIGIILMAVVTGSYTIIGGLKAVIVTDILQSILVLVAGIILAAVTFSQPEIGGWWQMVAMDRAAEGADKLHLYNATNHPQLPWSGVLTGLMVLHFYYWGANQFIVQRALSARDDREARLGIIAAGFFKLLIPFFSIGTGIAAYYFFEVNSVVVAQDVVFTELLTRLITPLGFGLAGLIAAGIVGAILSSLDSMMNSAATIVTFDIYKRYVSPQASERQLIWFGRACIVVFIVAAAVLTISTMNPNSQESFFLHIANHQGKLVAGVVVAFLMGMFWKRATAEGAFVAIVAGVILSYRIEPIYARYLGTIPSVANVFGPELNFFHAVFLAAIACVVLHVIISLMTEPPSDEKAKLTWVGIGVFSQYQVRKTLAMLCVSLGIYGLLGFEMYSDTLGFHIGDRVFTSSTVAAWIGATYTWLLFFFMALRAARTEGPFTIPRLIANDRILAGLLAALAVFMMYYFY